MENEINKMIFEKILDTLGPIGYQYQMWMRFQKLQRDIRHAQLKITDEEMNAMLVNELYNECGKSNEMYPKVMKYSEKMRKLLEMNPNINVSGVYKENKKRKKESEKENNDNIQLMGIEGLPTISGFPDSMDVHNLMELKDMKVLREKERQEAEEIEKRRIKRIISMKEITGEIPIQRKKAMILLYQNEDQSEIQTEERQQKENILYEINETTLMPVYLGRGKESFRSKGTFIDVKPFCKGRHISHIHAKIQFDYKKKSYTISCSGKNGLVLNGTSSEETSSLELFDNCLIEMGGLKLKFVYK